MIAKMPRSAMVLAAGLGTRMRPLTNDRPKPMIEVAEKPLIDFALDRFAEVGVERAVVNVHYLAEQVENHLAGRTSPEIVISDERQELLETGGGLQKARGLFVEGPIFCTNTDAIMIDGDGPEACTALASVWDGEQMDALLLLVPIERTSGYDGAGDFNRSVDGQIQLRKQDTAPFVFTGLQIIAQDLIDEGPGGAFSTRVLWDLAASRGRLFGVIYDGDWLHVGDPDGHAIAEKRLGKSR